MDHLYEKTISMTSIFKGNVISLRTENVQLPNGEETVRELVHHPGAVAIIPVTEEGKIVVVRQFRKALEKTIIEIPAGKLEPGEQPEASAHRELEEETGYIAKEMTYMTTFYTSPGFADELVHMYVAKNLDIGVVNRDDDEFMDVLTITLEEAKALIQSGDICDAKTMYAVQYMELHINK
ncbi:NUDIX domain-containing protein [Massilibacterium senegalense]|uniref:NUDIX domain-containing protein n=1 Tax=Massilibacterium senegalense TaxID=1632858 RepID=UPI0007824E8E|nr:NUDIX hydrolase [Massilibacterium senegalense]